MCLGKCENVLSLMCRGKFCNERNGGAFYMGEGDNWGLELFLVANFISRSIKRLSFLFYRYTQCSG